MADEDHENDDGGAAQAFADLQAEVSVMRRAIEGLPAILSRMETPDYAPSFGVVIKSLNETEARLAAIEGHPALKLTPDQHAGAMKRAGIEVMSDAARSLRNEADAVGREQQKLARRRRRRSRDRHPPFRCITLTSIAHGLVRADRA